MNLARRKKNYFVIENAIFDKYVIFANLRTKSRIDFQVDFFSVRSRIFINLVH